MPELPCEMPCFSSRQRARAALCFPRCDGDRAAPAGVAGSL